MIPGSTMDCKTWFTIINFGLVVLIWLIGLLWTIPVFLVLFLWLQAREPWRLIVAISLGTWAVVYLLFVQILSMDLYQGLIQNLLLGD